MSSHLNSGSVRRSSVHHPSCATTLSDSPVSIRKGHDAALGAANKAARDELPSELGSVRRLSERDPIRATACRALQPSTESVPTLPWAQPTRQLRMSSHLDFGSVRRPSERNPIRATALQDPPSALQLGTALR